MDDARNGKAQEGHDSTTNEPPGYLPLTPSSDRIVQWNTPKMVPKHQRASSATNVTQPQPSGRPSVGRHRSCTSMSALQLNSSGNGPATDPETARVPTDHRKRSWRPPGRVECHRELMLQIQAERALAGRTTARKQRRSCREEGNYLGVVGSNPVTGEPDHVTPFSSDERSELSLNTGQGHFHVPRNFTSTNASRDEKLVGEVQGESSTRQTATEPAADPRKFARQRDGSQWSSVQEPNLSPIVQSSLSGK